LIIGRYLVYTGIVVFFTHNSDTTIYDVKIKSRGFPILESGEVNITFQRLLWNDQN
jgi:hypothetical protein